MFFSSQISTFWVYILILVDVLQGGAPQEKLVRYMSAIRPTISYMFANLPIINQLQIPTYPTCSWFDNV